MTADAVPLPTAGRVPAVVRLTLSDFRNYGFLRLDTDDRPVVLTGSNGAGKTNILEALSFLVPGRGLRRARPGEVARRSGPGAPANGGDTPWAVAALVAGPEGPIEVGTGREAGSERRVVRIDGRPARSQAALGKVMSALWLTPAMDRLFGEGASGRRRFMDRLVYGLEPDHAGHAAAYEHALRERARLLRAGGADPAWLAVIEDAMARHGVAVAAARRRAVARLAEACRAGVGPFPAAGLAVVGTVEDWLGPDPSAEDAQQAAMARLKAGLRLARARERAQGEGAADGPHRSDFAVRHAARDLPAEACSTGEQKALLIAIVLGQARVQAAERGVAPMLLLDEVAAHLDEGRRAALFEEVCALGAQSWLTGTDDMLFAALGGRAQYFRVHDGVVAPAGMG